MAERNRIFKLLNINRIFFADDFKKHSLGRILTGHPNGPILYNSQENTLTYWSMKTNSFSGKKIQAPFKSKVIQGFYHPKLANIMSDMVRTYDNKIVQKETEVVEEGNHNFCV